MSIPCRYLIPIALALFLAGPAPAADLNAYITQYFTGRALEYGFGSGTSSNNPRVVAVTHYCASGYYYSIGQSCRPNLIAKGYQCSPYQDSGSWGVDVRGQQATLYWTSNVYGPGSMAIYPRNDGVVVDPRGNVFTYMGQAQCQ